MTGFKLCPSGHKNDKIALAAGHVVFNRRVSQCKTPIGAVGDDPSTHQKVVKPSQTGNPRRFSAGRMSIYPQLLSQPEGGLKGLAPYRLEHAETAQP